MRYESRLQKVERLEVKKIVSPSMVEAVWKKNYLNMVKAIRETPGVRSGWIAALEEWQRQKQKELSDYLWRIENEDKDKRKMVLPPISSRPSKDKKGLWDEGPKDKVKP